MIQNREIVTLFSNAQPNLFPSNTAYHFTNRLPHLWKIPQPEQWCVGVTEFSTLNTLDTIPSDLSIDVCIDNDPRFSKPRQMERFQFFMTGQGINKGLTEKDFDSRVAAMQHYHPNIPPSFENCNIPWKSLVNGLAGVTQQMLSQCGYNTYLMLKKESDAVKVGVKFNDTVFSNTRFVMSPALQHLLLLEHPTGVQTLKSFDALKDRYVRAKDRKFCDFWYRIIPSNYVTTQWPGFPVSVGTDPFSVLEALAKKYEFFSFEEQADGSNTTVKLKFKEMNNVVMVEFPENFLQLPDNNETSLTFKLSVSSPQYEITDKSKKPIKDTYPLGKHIKDSTHASTTAFFMTDGSEIQLSRKTSEKAPTGYQLKNFKLMTYYAKTGVTQEPYHQRYCIPRGNYTLQTFIDRLKQCLSNQSVIAFRLSGGGASATATAGGKRQKLSNSKNYTCTLQSTIPGYRISLHPRLQSILALDRNVIRDMEVLSSTRPILLSSFTYHLMLYCKFIKPNIQGGQLEPVLRTIPFPTQKRRAESIAMEFRDIQFHKLDVTTLEDMTIEIRDDTGEVVQLNDGRTMIKLAFVRGGMS